MILVIDNYDSFTYNLVHDLGELGAPVRVVRNDQVSVEEVLALKPQGVLLSPGPCTPSQAGITLDFIARAPADLPIFGVCLGYQAIGQAFGGRVVRAQALMHGKTSAIHHNGLGVFANLPDPFTAVRYHSLAVERATVPDVLEITAWTADGEVMGLRHRERPIEGVLFHPESYATEGGRTILGNVLRRAGALPPAVCAA